MQYHIVHELPKRLRVRLQVSPNLDLKGEYLKNMFAGIPGFENVQYKSTTKSLVLRYNGEKSCKRAILDQLSACCISHFVKNNQPVEKKQEDPKQRLAIKKRALIRQVLLRLIGPLLPLPIRVFLLTKSSYQVISKGISPLMQGNINAEVLDASAVSVALALREFGTVRTIALLLQVSDYLEDWTKQKSKESLTGLFDMENEWAWVLRKKTETRIPVQEIIPGDVVVVREGHKIPVDGIVSEGEAMVSQACITGEALPVRKYKGVTVYAGTVLVEGKLLIEAVKVAGATRVSQMIKIIEESEDLKASLQSKAELLADKIVPYSFLLSGLTWLATGSAYKAASALLVDYSCAIKLATPLTLMSSMISASKNGVLIKGGKFIEKMANIDTFVLDKTGTLTEAKPEVVDVVPFNGFSREYLLRNVACVEEHFPHPVATAVVRKASEEGLDHEEEHSEVNHIVAHGIASEVNGKEILVGSRHFINEDKNIDLKIAEKETRKYLADGRSILYVAIGGELAGLVVIEDPLRTDAGDFVQALQNKGIRKVVMLTGDNDAAASKVAREVNIRSYHSQVFPEDKTRIIKELGVNGHKVAMVGDGMNDAPALSSADVGISMHHGADIAKEVCDVLLMKADLEKIIFARELSQKTLKRIKNNYFSIVGINSLLIGLGIMGMVPPVFSAFMHNATTVVVAANSLRKF